MAKIKFLAKWSLKNQQDLNIPKGMILLKYDMAKYRKYIGAFLLRLDEWEKAHSDTREIEVELQIRYKDRSLDQNALMWSLYEIEAKEQNAGMAGSVSQMVTKDELYFADLDAWGERDEVQTTISRLQYYLLHYKIVRYLCSDDKFTSITKFEEQLLMRLEPETKITLQITRGTSQYNTVEMARHIQGVFNRLSETVGISDTGQLALYKEDFDKFKLSQGFDNSCLKEKED